MKSYFALVSFLFLNSVAAGSEALKPVFVCENEEAVVSRDENDSTRYQLELKNNDINMYLGLGYLAKPEGQGAPSDDDVAFVGFSRVSRFDEQVSTSGIYKTLHVFPDYGGLKVVVETEPFYYCHYSLNYGDSGGMTHTVKAQAGTSCPDLYPSYSYRNASPGFDFKTSVNWFFQNCRGVE